ncbi:MAG: chloride channel protein [Alphaproteobacteria bacterium]|nr:chloride channel protein [Alphaproteobacteria bacterium]
MSRALVRPSGDVIGRPRRTGWRMWALAVLVGVLTGFAVVALRTLVAYSEFLFFGAAGQRLTARIAAMPWFARMVSPVVGGAVVALMLRLGVSFGWGPSPRPFGIEDVIAGRRLRATIRTSTLALKDAFLSALIAIVSLGSGASAGRESPSIHLGASLAMLPGRLLGLSPPERRMLLGMGAAAAFSAALHAPLAAIFLVRELILPRQRFITLGPLAIASVTGWLMARWAFGDASPLLAPHLGPTPLSFQFAAPVAAIPLAFVAWAAAWAWTRAPKGVDQMAARIRFPLWLLPPFGALLIGVLAIAFPAATGIGYAPIEAGLGGHYALPILIALAAAKVAAASVAVAFRFGGGRIAPALYVGAMAGSAMGVAATLFAGDAALGQAFFGLVGMGVALSVLLDAPLAATLLMFELSGSPAVAIATLIAVHIAGLITRQLPPTGAKSEAESQPLYWT